MPVSTSAIALAPQTVAAELNNGSTAGLQKLTSGPIVDRDHGGGAIAARNRHVLAAGREIDFAGDDLLAILSLVHRTFGDAGEVLASP